MDRLHSDPYSHGHANPDADGDTDAHDDGDADTDSDAHGNAHGDSHGNAHADANPHGDSAANGDESPHAYAQAHGHPHSNPQLALLGLLLPREKRHVQTSGPVVLLRCVLRESQWRLLHQSRAGMPVTSEGLGRAMSQTMRIFRILVPITIAAVLSSAWAEEKTWTLQICKPATRAKKVYVEIGPPGRNRSIKKEWATWEREKVERDLQEYDAPTEASGSQNIWVRATAKPKDHEVHMAVLFRGTAKKVFDFKNKDSSEVGANDADREWKCP